MNEKRKAFTVLEIILVLIIISILASLVLPKFSLSKESAQLSKVRSDIGAIRMGILLYKNKTILSGSSSYPATLDDSLNFDANGEKLFGNGILAYPIVSSKKSYSWTKVGKKEYALWFKSDIDDELVPTYFDYDDGNGTFYCELENENCLKVTQ